MDIVRNYWGIDVTIITQRAKSRNDESGICLYEKGSIQSYGEQQRYWLQSKQYVLLAHFQTRHLFLGHTSCLLIISIY